MGLIRHLHRNDMRGYDGDIPGICHLCRQTVAGHRVRSHLQRCIEERAGLRPARTPRQRDGRRLSLKTAHLSVRAVERPHWLELGVRCDATLLELDAFLRAVWLECCGHLSNFQIDGNIYAVNVPLPGSGRRFQPEYPGEEDLRHMGRTVNAAVLPLTRFRHEYDYGTPTELQLEYAAVYGELVQAVAPSQPWHGGRIVVLARNHPLRHCLRCGAPAHWKCAPEYAEYEEYDDQLHEDEGVLCEDDLDPITFCDDCAPPEADLLPLTNSPRAGADCYDNVHSWRTWPLAEREDR